MGSFEILEYQGFVKGLIDHVLRRNFYTVEVHIHEWEKLGLDLMTMERITEELGKMVQPI